VATLARLPLLPAEHAPADGGGLLREGMFLASRQLGGDIPSAGQMALTARGYELRARFRPTPHGVFAGVTFARLSGEPALLRLGERHRARSNPSGAWLSAVCGLLLDGPDGSSVLRCLTLTANNTALRRGDRWEGEAQVDAGHADLNRVMVRATEAVDLIMNVCGLATSAGDVLAEVAARWPQAPEQMVAEAISGLVRHGFLLTDLLPADVSNDPVGHLLSRLPDTHPMCARLAEVRRLLAAADGHRPGAAARLEMLSAARDLADEVCVVDRPLTVDVAVDGDLTVPVAVARQAADAASVLWRIADQQGLIEAYHQRFLHRYGPHRFVPLLEAADPVIGIGIDVDPQHVEPSPEVTPRTAVLTGLITRAAARHEIEVMLDEQTIAALAEPAAAGTPPRSAEVYVRLVAGSLHDLEEGRLRVVVGAGGSQNAGSTPARFVSLLGHSHNEPQTDGALVAELLVRPRTAAAQTLAPPAGFTQHRIAVGVPCGEGDLPLTDLQLVSDGTCMAVWSASQDRQVIPVLYSRLTAGLLPPLARLLQLLGHAGTRPWQTWSWGSVGGGPFQPRVRYRDAILSPARWTIPAALTSAARDQKKWDTELDLWRSNVVPGLPGIVVTDDADRHLPLDLGLDTDRALLRRYVRRGLTAVTELPGGDGAIQAVATGPLGRHVVELAIPLTRRTDPPAPVHRAHLPPRLFSEGLFLPGGPWLSLAITTPIHCQDELLAGLVSLAAELKEDWDSWFWLRYRTPELGPHLRVRFLGEPATLGGRVLPAVSNWVSTMTRRRLSGGLTIEPYDQEIERYGGTSAIRNAENVFAADSQLALALLTGDDDQRLTAAALTAVTIARIVAPNDLSTLHGRHVDRATHQRLSRLRPHVRAAGSRPPNLPREPWVGLLDTLAAYRDILAPARRASCASSLIHMHANRVLTTADDEPLMRALAADLLSRPS
jgi:thiopeptide-type bacteriocin biosynthesis protein